MQLIAFLLVMTAITGLIHWYLWRRLVRDTTRPGRVRRAGTVLAVLLALLAPATLVGSRALEPAVARWLAWPGYLWVAVMFYLLIGLLVVELPRALALRRAARGDAAAEPARAAAAPPRAAPGAAPEPHEPQREAPGGSRESHDTLAPDGGHAGVGVGVGGARAVSRRLLISRSSAALVGAAAVGLVGYGAATALGRPRITALPVTLPRLPAALDGLRIAVVSDIHLGPLRGRAHTERIVSMINEQRPDLVAIVGDLVDGTVDELGEAAAPLRDLVSPHGSFFVTGNHEYYSGAAPWLAELARLGVDPLVNERVEITVAGARLDLAGVNDVSAENTGDEPDFERALGGRDATRPVVLLAHQPVVVDRAAEYGVDLQLSGHTHGGQLFPFHGLVRLEQPVLSGLASFGDTQLFVTRGAGFWGPPVRVGAPPEIAVVRLSAPPG